VGFWEGGFKNVIKGRVSVRPGLVVLMSRDVKVHEQKRMWEWGSKDDFVAFVTGNESPTMKEYTSRFTTDEKRDITSKVREILDTEFPGMETFEIPMISNILVAHKK
jgi:hypothetical protein